MSYKLHTKEIVKRNRKIYKMRMRGMTYKAIGKKFEISGQRARQIFGSVQHQLHKKGFYS